MDVADNTFKANIELQKKVVLGILELTGKLNNLVKKRIFLEIWSESLYLPTVNW